MDLVQFGQRLKQLRKMAGVSQNKLADALQAMADSGPLDDFRVIDGRLISNWERAATNKKGHSWRPSYPYVIHLLTYFADHLTRKEASLWATQAGYQIASSDLAAVFPDVQITTTPASQPLPNTLPPPPPQQLFGVEEAQETVEGRLISKSAPWLIAIEGIGGIGKTTLATVTTHAIWETERFPQIVWISAKQEEYLPHLGVQTIEQPTLDARTFIDTLLEQLDPALSLSRPPAEKLAMVQQRLKATPHLIIIDNLETVVDYQALLPTLRQLLNPTKFLLTSRYSLREEGDVYSWTLREL
ncbi:MAG: NB-ARC domain-containing protein, partial [Chloroflexota bacterium]